ncbi:hypothetical protein D9613_009872 [Agrocybe pediades]|uniref:Rab-GAP TBC domain-containing protein n=1 Tax=Agrocybe pediades TaxID=84607 RepID=A0A8H4QXV2_9AGAR|nr:hypothetical protein D9613_009872 [Agrocybe pediades]
MTIPKPEPGHEDPKPNKVDWDALRARSLQKGGFGEERVYIWPKLLNVSQSSGIQHEVLQVDEKAPHQDERQIGLDTDRSFVLYPVEPNFDREVLQTELNKLLVSFFRKRPRLSYFQGYHDIVTVIFLTMPQELQLLCVEKLSLHRLRDSMGSGLEPVLGLLRITKNLLRLADAQYAELLERNSPLPFYALSNLLTLFAHDIPTLPLIQHVFDYLLCRPPIAVIYVATAIILSRKKEVLRLQEEDEDGMIHSLLSSLPNLADDPEDENDDGQQNVSSNTFFKEEQEAEEDAATGILEHPSNSFLGPVVKLEEPDAHTKVPDIVDGAIQDVTGNHEAKAETENPSTAEEPDTSTILESTDNIDEKDPLLLEHIEKSTDSVQKVEEQAEEVVLTPHRPKASKHYLTDLLKHADELYKEYPPTHPSLSLSSIMGPQSVVFTWSESPSGLPSDNTAEAMVLHPELVVYPYVEPSDADQKEGASSSETSGKKGRRRDHKKLKKKSPFEQVVEKKTMLAGTVLVLGVAMAVYGIKARQSGGGAHGPLSFYYAMAEPGRGAGNTVKEWKRLGGWIGGALAGVSEKVIQGLSPTRN